MFKAFTLISGAAIVCALSACATPGSDQDTQVAASDMPEYSTGSIIAKKKKSAAADNLKSMTAEQLEEVRQNSSIPIR
jgi:hypothetical protein